jgi:L-ascorbate metabolism protein UlaG (beta-lactamase superfamily)
VLEVADRLYVDVALLHLGDVKFGITGPVHYSMTAEEAVALAARVGPRVAIPVHYEGWSHFREGRDTIERVVAAAPTDVRERFRFMELGVPETITM